MAKKNLKNVPKTLPRTLRVFVNNTGDDDFYQINETPEDAYLGVEGDEGVIVGVYELKEKVRLKFRVEELPA